MLGRSMMTFPTLRERSAAPSLCAQVAKASKPLTAVAISAGNDRRLSPFSGAWVDTVEGFGKASPLNGVASSVTYRVPLR